MSHYNAPRYKYVVIGRLLISHRFSPSGRASVCLVLVFSLTSCVYHLPNKNTKPNDNTVFLIITEVIMAQCPSLPPGHLSGICYLVGPGGGDCQKTSARGLRIWQFFYKRLSSSFFQYFIKKSSNADSFRYLYKEYF